MSEPPHVVAVCGSLRDASHTQTALRHVLDAAEDRGATTDLLDLRALDMPVFDADDREPGDVPELKRRVRAADAVVLGTPVYHGSYASPLKTALDYCGFDEFDDTTVGLLAVAGGSFPVTALEHLRSVCRAVNAWVVPHQVAIPRAYDQFEERDAHGGTELAFVDEELEDRVETLGERLVQYARIEPDPSTFESAENVGADD